VPLVSVVLYGATGYTGRLVAHELARRGLDRVLSGRDPAKLARLADEHRVPVRAVSLDDPDGLRSLLKDARVVINCAGPFTLAGDALVRAAIDTGTHYLDSTGEQTFIQMVFERHGAGAERAGVALVPAAAFDYLPGDCIARGPRAARRDRRRLRGQRLRDDARHHALRPRDDAGTRPRLHRRRLAHGPGRHLPGELPLP
jgi:short subunit dehydrogenase-like uncharacterized protein